jgi:multiple sugar transport system substrate-binding protein
VVEALNAYAGLIHEHRIAPPLSVVAEAGLSDLFRSGRSAMFMGGAADNLDRLPGLDVTVAEVPAGPAGRATFAWSAGLHISAAVEDPRAVFPLYRRVLERIHRWKIPAPRRSLAARLEEFEPRKAPAAEVIRRAMETMRPPAAGEHHARWETIFAEELLDPLLRVGPPAGPIVERAAPPLEAVR